MACHSESRITQPSLFRVGHYQSLGKKQARLTSQQTALVIHLAQGSKAVTAGELIAAGLFRPNAARSTVHSALLTLRRKLDELEPELGAKLLRSTPRGYSLGLIV